MTRREELELELKLLKETEEAERKARRLSVKRVWEFSIVKTDNKLSSWLQIRDSSVIVYVLRGKVVNDTELEAVGNASDYIRGGCMNYLYNTLSGKIIKADSGGSLYISEESTYDKLEEFISNNSDGGIVTGIIVNQSNFKW